MYKDDDKYYAKMTKVVKSLFDGKWEQMVIRICKDEFHSSIGVYCKIENVFKLIGDYLVTGELDFAQHNSINSALSDIADEMQRELKEENQDVWKTMIFTLKEDGKFEVEYSYDSLDENEFRETIRWRYNKLGMIPNEKNMKYINS